MNYKRIIVSTLALALVAPFSLAFAEVELDASFSGKASTSAAELRAIEVRAGLEAKRASSTDRRENRRENIAEKKASSTERRVEFQQNIAKRHVEYVVKVMLATIERLEKLITRIESRIAKVQAEGGTTTEAEGFVADAKINLSDAKLSVTAFADLDLSSDKARDNFEKIRALAMEAREHIRDTRENLIKAMRSLKPIKIKTETEGSVEP